MNAEMPMFPSFLANETAWTGTRPEAVFVWNHQASQIDAKSSVQNEDMESRLIQLLEEDCDPDEFGAVGPSQHAFATTLRIIRMAEKRTSLRLVGAPVVDSTGGIRVTWKRSDREMRLVCPSTRNEALYAYVQSSAENKILREITPDVLVEQWAWLVSGGDLL